MSDSPKQPATPPAAPPIKDAVPDGVAEKPPVSKQLTFSQQLFIWTMVLVVGVIFGVGASFSLVFAPTQKIAGVAEGEVLQRMRVAERMEKVLNPNGHYYYPLFRQQSLETYATDLRLARVGEARDLMPKGRALDRVEQDFLATPIQGSAGRTYLDALREHEGGNDEIQRDDLRRYLAENAARESLFMRSAIAPAVPRAVAADVAATNGDRAEVAEVLLSGARFVPEVKGDDPEIAAAFERLRATRFTRPGSVGVAVAWADRDQLAAGIEVSDADAKAWYDGHSDQFAGEPDPKDPAKKPEPKPFEQVKAEVIAKVKAERGSAAAQALIMAFNQAAEDLENDKDPARFRSAATAGKLQIAELSVEDRTPGSVDLGRIGTLKDVMRIFGREHELGFLSQPQQTSAGHWVVLRLESRREPGFQELDAVRDQVARHLAGRRAWKQLQEQAAKLRDELSAKGPGALAAWAASDDAKAWNATISTKPQKLIGKLSVPPAEVDGAAGEPQLIAALAMPPRPVALVAAEPAWEGDIPRVRLVQVGEIKPMNRDGLAESALADGFRNGLRRFGMMLFDRELQAQLEGK
ncbi:MAG: hypothetical protein J0M02_07215 [Planctomycetes bacterium]|nr:hypothetical protein [Planctomycetota bacterium]